MKGCPAGQKLRAETESRKTRAPCAGANLLLERFFAKDPAYPMSGTDGSKPFSSREESGANPVLAAQGACLRANKDGRATTRPHRYGRDFPRVAG